MEYLYYLAIYLVFINIVTTYRLVKTENYKVTQKIIQFILLWALPIIGVFIVVFFLNQEPIVLNLPPSTKN
jgi:TRAP-type C4-dicarboxylate transport system permease small subunit